MRGSICSNVTAKSLTTRISRCIVKLGTSGTIVGFDIDTTYFNGNEGPEAAVEALFDASPEVPQVNDARVSEYNYYNNVACTYNWQWSEILPKVPLGPSSRHLFKIPESSRVNYVKLKMIPDGGIVSFGLLW